VRVGLADFKQGGAAFERGEFDHARGGIDGDFARGGDLHRIEIEISRDGMIDAAIDDRGVFEFAGIGKAQPGGNDA
jgi:hypothetical protein